MDIELKCGCRVTRDGKFLIGVACAECRECNFVSEVHPFGRGRLDG